MKKVTRNIMKIKENYEPLKMGFVFDSIIEGYTHADVYVNDLEEVFLSIVCEGHSFYFGGEGRKKSDYQNAVNFFKEHILDEKKRAELGVVKLYFSSDMWKNILLESFEGFNVNIYERVLFNHELQNIPSHKSDDKDLIIKEIDKTIIDSQLENIDEVLDEINLMWGCIDNFLENGFGYYGIKDEKIICWCTTEYMSKSSCGIGIETVEGYQKQGVATIAALHVLKKCLELNLIPHWDSWKANIPSVRVAEKNEFKKILDYEVIFVRF